MILKECDEMKEEYDFSRAMGVVSSSLRNHLVIRMRMKEEGRRDWSGEGAFLGHNIFASGETREEVVTGILEQIVAGLIAEEYVFPSPPES